WSFSPLRGGGDAGTRARTPACRWTVSALLVQLVHLVDHLLATAGGPAVDVGLEPGPVDLTGGALRPGIHHDLVEDGTVLQVGLGHVGRSRVEHGRLHVLLVEGEALLVERRLGLALRLRRVPEIAVGLAADLGEGRDVALDDRGLLALD